MSETNGPTYIPPAISPLEMTPRERFIMHQGAMMMLHNIMLGVDAVYEEGETSIPLDLLTGGLVDTFDGQVAKFVMAEMEMNLDA